MAEGVMGRNERFLRAVPPLLRSGTERMEPALLSCAHKMEAADEAGRETPPMRILPAEFRQFPAVQDSVQTEKRRDSTAGRCEQLHSVARLRIIPVSVAAQRRPPLPASMTRVATAR